jgi:hypothetical protein
MASAETGRKQHQGELNTLRSNCGGVTLLGPITAGTLTTIASGAPDVLLDINDGEPALINSGRFRKFGHGDGSLLALSIALNGADNDTVTARIWGLLPMVAKSSSSINNRQFRRDPLLQFVATGSTHVGLNGGLVPDTFRWADGIAISWDRLQARPVVMGPVDASGAPLAGDNHAIELMFDPRAYPDYEIEIGSASGSATAAYVAWRFVSGM